MNRYVLNTEAQEDLREIRDYVKFTTTAPAMKYPTKPNPGRSGPPQGPAALAPIRGSLEWTIWNFDSRRSWLID
jgi:hypothetical protein